MSRPSNETMDAPEESLAPAALALGSIVGGKYRLDEKLGEGGMGVVYGGTHLELKTRVAIKFLLADAARDPRAKARFLREARLAASMQGDHCTRIHDVTTDENGRPFLVMEYLAGETVDARLRREKRLPLGDAVTIVLQLLDALAEAHAKGLIHRDVKPANVFLAHRPGEPLWVKVLDFGISKLTDETRGDESITLTAPRTLLGSPEYMSPEQLRDSANVDPRSDLWACGITLYELLSGETPFRGATLADLCANVISQRPRTLAEAGVDVPPEIERVLRKCLAREPADRPAHAYELAVALAPFAPDEGRALLPRIRAWFDESAVSTRSSPAAPPRRRFFVGGVALVALAGALAFVAASVRYATGTAPSAVAAAAPSSALVPSVTASDRVTVVVPPVAASVSAAGASAASASASAGGRTAGVPRSGRAKANHDLDAIDLLE